MTNKRKKSIRNLAAQHGINRRAAASRLDQDRVMSARQAYPNGAIEVLVFDQAGRDFRGIVWFVPPGMPNGAIDPDEGLIMGGIPALKAGPYLLVEPTGRARHVVAERGAGGGAFMTVCREPDTFVAVQIAYASAGLDAYGMPPMFVRYKIVPDRSPPPGGYKMGILPITDAATMKGLRTFGLQAWRELFALLDAAHSGLAQRVALEDAQVTRGDSFDTEEHAAAISALREAAGIRGGVQGRVLRTEPVNGVTLEPTTQADLDDLGAADRIFQDVQVAQMAALRLNQPARASGRDGGFSTGTRRVLRLLVSRWQEASNAESDPAEHRVRIPRIVITRFAPS